MTLDIRNAICDFWFNKTPQKNWFMGGEAFDISLKERWLDYYQASLDGQFIDWRGDAKGALALCLLWDQFPRNAFRGTPRAFATDYLALDVANEAINLGYDKDLSPTEKMFLYLPLEHSERLDNQARSVALFEPLGLQMSLDYAIKHAKAIQMLGRFPGRNACLGRRTTKAEADFLASDEGQSF